MPSPEIVLASLEAQYPEHAQTPLFLKLYSEEPPLNAVFASFHERLNGHFTFMNQKQDRGGHFNADDSRDLLDLIGEIRQVRTDLARVRVKIVLRDDYQATLDECLTFLSRSGGSPMPKEFRVEIERFEPVFSAPADVAVPASKKVDAPQVALVGEGAFALVHRYVDPDYGFNVAVKTAKNNLTPRDLERFRKEFEILKSFDFPYIVEAYAYDDAKDSYTMEYCDTTLDEFITKNNDKLTWSTRKRIALQFLYGINYLHRKRLMHRDISRKNVLIRQYDEGAVMAKLSDFGLFKDDGSDFTKVDSDLKGTILDPTIVSFKDFDYTNDIYAVGVLLSFIFTGKKGVNSATGEVRGIVAKCIDNVPPQRYASVAEVIAAVDALPASEQSNSSQTPA